MRSPNAEEQSSYLLLDSWSMWNKLVVGWKYGIVFLFNPLDTKSWLWFILKIQLKINSRVTNGYIFDISTISKICIIEVYILKYYFESHFIYKWRYYRQTILNQLNIMVAYVNIIGYTIVSQFYEKSMWCGINVVWGGCPSI